MTLDRNKQHFDFEKVSKDKTEIMKAADVT